jgi:hypothetical protein
MARPRLKIAKDTPEVVSARVRTRPVDESIVVAKMADGTIIYFDQGKLALGTYANAAGDLPYGAPVIIDSDTGALTINGRKVVNTISINRAENMIDEKTRKSLKPGIATQYAYSWFNEHQRRMSSVRGQRWEPVKRKDNEVACPFAFGDETDGLFHMGDQILCKRELDYHKGIVNGMKIYNDPKRRLEETSEQASEDLRAAMHGVSGVTQTFEPAENDSVVLSSE